MKKLTKMEWTRVAGIVTVLAISASAAVSVPKVALGMDGDSVGFSSKAGGDTSEGTAQASAIGFASILVGTTLGAVLKKPVHVAAPDAINFRLYGGAPSDAFRSAQHLIEQQTGEKFQSDDEAAIGIIRLDKALNAAE